jgi:ribosomal protein S18 acetylase RimI-like enzyme
MCKNNGVAVAAWDREQLIGFTRAVSDGIFRAYIEDVVVYQHYRNKGVGDRLIEEIITELANIDIVSLFCEDKLSNFYQKQSFEKTNQIVMHRTKKPTREKTI